MILTNFVTNKENIEVVTFNQLKSMSKNETSDFFSELKNHDIFKNANNLKLKINEKDVNFSADFFMKSEEDIDPRFKIQMNFMILKNQHCDEMDENHESNTSELSFRLQINNDDGYRDFIENKIYCSSIKQSVSSLIVNTFFNEIKGLQKDFETIFPEELISLKQNLKDVEHSHSLLYKKHLVVDAYLSLREINGGANSFIVNNENLSYTDFKNFIFNDIKSHNQLIEFVNNGVISYGKSVLIENNKMRWSLNNIFREDEGFSVDKKLNVIDGEIQKDFDLLSNVKAFLIQTQSDIQSVKLDKGIIFTPNGEISPATSELAILTAALSPIVNYSNLVLEHDSFFNTTNERISQSDFEITQNGLFEVIRTAINYRLEYLAELDNLFVKDQHACVHSIEVQLNNKNEDNGFGSILCYDGKNDYIGEIQLTSLVQDEYLYAQNDLNAILNNLKQKYDFKPIISKHNEQNIKLN